MYNRAYKEKLGKIVDEVARTTGEPITFSQARRIYSLSLKGITVRRCGVGELRYFPLGFYSKEQLNAIIRGVQDHEYTYNKVNREPYIDPSYST